MAHESHRTHCLRRGRRSIPNQIYLITTVTHNREPFFNDLRAGRGVVRALMAAEISARSLAFVVMPDHLHWLMQLREGYDLPKVVHFVKSISARTVNRTRCRRGAVWQKGYHEHAIRREEVLQDCARYIINNPVRAGLVSEPGAYRWSGYGAALGGEGLARGGLRRWYGLVQERQGECAWAQVRGAYRRWLYGAAMP